MRAWTRLLAAAALGACSDAVSPETLDTVTFTAVSGGIAHSCAMNSTGASYCWGYNGAGAVGVRSGGLVSNTPQPVVVGPLQLSKVDAGDETTCGLLSTGTPLCWGEGESAARELPGKLQLSDIGVGRFGCGLRADSAAVCWESLDSESYAIESSRFVQVSVGGFACGVTLTGTVECWGQSGTVATPVPGAAGFASVSVGGDHACGLLVNRELHCWGGNFWGQLGDFTTTNRESPAPVGSNLLFITVAAGERHSCAIAENGEAYCWGRANDGQIGFGGVTSSLAAPTRVRGGDLPTGSRWTAIAAGGEHSCGTTAEGRVYCWGANTGGQVGDGTTETQLSPKLIGAEP